MRAACVFYTLALVFGALSTTQAQSSCNAPVATATASDILTIMQSMQKQLKSMSAEISTLKTNATTCAKDLANIKKNGVKNNGGGGSGGSTSTNYGGAKLNQHGGGWYFVNVAGRSITDINDLVPTYPGKYTLPTYKIPFKFNEVLIQRTTSNWCDSWGRKTGHWVGNSGASMGIQADMHYWYTFNNHGGKHTWIRQPASYLKSGACRGCWQWPGNGNSADTKGVTVGELAAGSLGGKNGDGSVVKIHFPTYHDMLKVGNLDAFYNQAGGCDANGVVKYRTYIRATGGRAHSAAYGGNWTFVNEAGKSTADTNDLSIMKQGGYHVPKYVIKKPFTEVLVERTSPNWCDSWGRKTGQWVGQGGASMGVKADSKYWYTFNNHGGKHTWLRQPADYLPPGKCSACWKWPGNNNDRNTRGVTIQNLVSDGSVVYIKFPEPKTELSLGNLDAFYKQAGGCDADGPVQWRAFVRHVATSNTKVNATVLQVTTLQTQLAALKQVVLNMQKNGVGGSGASGKVTQTYGGAKLNHYGGNWFFVNTQGRSITNIDDLMTCYQGKYDLPTYKIPFRFNEVLVQRVSTHWCDSWGRKTGHWVGNSGASMGIQADTHYWYTFNNHGGKHTWIRQPASYLKPGVCKGCWQWPGNGNSADTKGVSVQELNSGSLGGKNGDGSVVKISFPTYHDMLKVGNLDAFYNQAGGCDAGGPVKYRTYIRATGGTAHSGAYGGGWTFVNEAGRSTADTNDLSIMKQGGYNYPKYVIKKPFTQVLVERTSPNWCDSWGRKTGQWVGSGGASMGVKADSKYWYTFNNHGGKHTWLRQPASYLPSGRCSGCWQWPGNGNDQNTRGVSITNVKSDGSVVLIKFPEAKTELAIGNLDAFYQQAGGCDADGPVQYRTFVKYSNSSENATHLEEFAQLKKSFYNKTNELEARVKRLEERTKGSIPCSQIVPSTKWSQTCVDKVTKSNSVLWSNRNYGWVTAPSELLSGMWTYVRPQLSSTASPCTTEGGFDGELKATADVAICCANHCGKTNLPVSSAPVGGWYQHSGKYSISNHGVQPCTFFEAKNVKPGKYKFCCTKCWGSGVFFGAGDNTPPAIDKYTVKTASATPCSEVKNTRGGQYGSCMERGAKIGTPLWSNRNYAWKGGPKDLLDGTWTYNKVHLDGGPCAREGGFEGKVTVPSVAAICCANHCGRTNVPSGGETWSKHPGVFSITNHGGTPCTFYETTLKPNKQYKLCCSACWASGVMFKHAAA